MPAPLDRLRVLCLALPGTSERLSHGTPAWFINDKRQFVTYVSDHHGDARIRFWCAAPPGAQAALVAARPEMFFRPPYVGHRGWLGVYLHLPVDWGEIAGVVEEAYRQVAPVKLLARLDQP